MISNYNSTRKTEREPANMELSAEMAAYCDTHAFMKKNHIHLAEVEQDRVITTLDAGPDSLNPYGFVHGGALFTMADCACGAAARTDGRKYVTLSSSFNFLHSGLKGDAIRAEAKVRRRGHTTCYVDVDLTNGQGELLASGSFTFFCIE